MQVILWYFAKVILGSGILTGYYFLALRNKVFHKWNRFYLLISVVLSLALPLIRIDIFQNDLKDTGVVQLIKNINDKDSAIVMLRPADFSSYLWSGIEICYIMISLIICMMLLHAIYKIYQWKKFYPKTKIQDIEFLDTDLKRAPFSFFNYIFWNKAIDMQSNTGKQILIHEITHVKQFHTHDKIFMNTLLVCFWINPFFFIIKKELNMIHEFIADQEAIADNDINSYCSMILKTIYPGQDFSITNNFFYSPLKRRLLMLIKNQHPRKSYLGRIIAIPLLVLIFSAFTFKIKEAIKSTEKQPAIGQYDKYLKFKGNSAIYSQKDTIPDLVYDHKKVIRVDNSKDPRYLVVTFTDGTKKKILKKDMPPPPPPIALNAPPPPPPIGNFKPAKAPKAPPAPSQIRGDASLNTPPPPPPPSFQSGTGMPDNAFYLLNGQPSQKAAVIKIDPSQIKEVKILNAANGTARYGEKGKNGVIEINTKGNQVQKIQLKEIPSQADQSKAMTFTKVEQEATFPGGEKGWFDYLSGIIRKNISSLSEKDQGTCLIRFIVEKDGSISDIQAITMKGTKLGDLAINAIKDGPKWNPGMQNGHIVRSYRDQPITFKMEQQ